MEEEGQRQGAELSRRVGQRPFSISTSSSPPSLKCCERIISIDSPLDAALLSEVAEALGDAIVATITKQNVVAKMHKTGLPSKKKNTMYV